MKKPTKTAAKPAAKPVVAAKRPRTYKKSDLPRTARAYLGKTYGIYMDKENEAVARLIELHEEKKLTHEEIRKQQSRIAEQQKYVNRFSDPARNAYVAEQQTIQTVGYGHQSITPYEEVLSKKPTLREQFLAWIGAKNG